MQAILYILTAQANKPFQNTVQYARVQTGMAARQKPVLNRQPNPAHNTVYPLPQDPRIHRGHPQSIGINHSLTFNNSINNSNQSFSALLHEVHATLELGAGYQNIDRPAPGGAGSYLRSCRFWPLDDCPSKEICQSFENLLTSMRECKEANYSRRCVFVRGDSTVGNEFVVGYCLFAVSIFLRQYRV